MGLGETPRRLIRKRSRHYSREKFEDAFDSALYLCKQKPSDAPFSAIFSNFDKCRPEAPGDVISGMALDHVGMDVTASLGGSRLNSGRIIRLFVRLDPFCALLCSI